MHQFRPRPGSPACWLLAARPRTLFAGITPIIFGCVLAAGDRGFHWLAAGAALLTAVLIQVGTNLANDYWDWKKGADTKERLGPLRVTSAGLLPPRAVFAATIVAFGLAALIGLYAVWRGGWPFLVIGLSAILCGFLYTAGPYPLAYLGLGELFVIVFFGPVAVAGTYYLQTLEWNWVPVLVGLAPGSYSVALLSVNNLRDRQEDAGNRKRTLAVRFGSKFARIEYLVCVAVPVVIPMILFALNLAQPWILVVSVVSLAVSLPVIRRFLQTPEGAGLNQFLGETGRLSMIYTLVFAIAWLIWK